ncbi:hypothetical protein O181_040612 [Austropuccinia psidii MF-1]|uniref:Uncharacterized protein n=1 Tax=Austropuccinia psidii MF-1 TaxID=1389203 RepID=A0A9Q3DJ59_9BASI|nr:hypothetical protein [Austropuccinia psidii MF-1]
MISHLACKSSDECFENGHQLDTDAITITVPLTSILSGFILLKFGHFLLASRSKEQRFARIWGSVALSVHIIQCVAQFENASVILRRFVVSEPFNIFLYEAIETLSTMLIVIIVQIHFARVVHILVLDKHKWSLLAGTCCLITGIGGVGTSALLITELSHGRLNQDTPARLSTRLTACWTSWLSSATFFDVILSCVLTHQVLKHRASTTQNSLKNSLRRILMISVNAFLMTSLTSVIAIILVIVAMTSPTDNYFILNRLRVAAFIINSCLPRIYLLAFCATIKPGFFGNKLAQANSHKKPNLAPCFHWLPLPNHIIMNSEERHPGGPIWFTVHFQQESEASEYTPRISDVGTIGFSQ